MKEQAALSAAEITADSLKDFATDSEGESEAEELPKPPKESKPMWNQILSNLLDMSKGRDSKGPAINNKNGSAWVPKVNGKHSKHVKYASLKVEKESATQGFSLSEMIQANIPMYKEVLPGLESWQVNKITSWHNMEGHSILWLCVVSIDRRGNNKFYYYQAR